jgi:hypothetical protein
MNNRVYLLITVLLLILPFTLAEASVMGTSTREPIGAPSWSVTIPAMNAPSTRQRIILAEANSALQQVSTTRGKKKEPVDVLMQVSTTRGKKTEANSALQQVSTTRGKKTQSNDALMGVSTTRGKISENESPRPQDRVKLPKQDPNQSTKQGKTQPDPGTIFDRWGKK